MKVLLLLATGGVVTSLVEFFLEYNLIDKIVDGYRYVVGKLKNVIAFVKARL